MAKGKIRFVFKFEVRFSAKASPQAKVCREEGRDGGLFYKGQIFVAFRY